jgi:hypothetical protein
VGYVKKNFLHGLELPPGLDALNAAVRHWMDTIANVRIHGETRKQPVELFAVEKAHLKPLPPLPADTAVTDTVRVTAASVSDLILFVIRFLAVLLRSD